MPLDESYYPWLFRVILCGNQKGGAGKSSIVSNVAAIAALQHGMRVLVIDSDQQGNLSRRDLGVTGDGGVGLAKAIQFGDDLTPIPTGRKNLSLVPGGKALKGAIHAVSGADIPVADNLGGAIARTVAQNDYDLVLVDTGPGDVAILAPLLDIARYLVVPSARDEGSLDGVEMIAEEYAAALGRGSRVQLLGAVLFRANPRASRINREVFGSFADLTAGAAAPFTAIVREAGSVADDQRALGKTVIELIDIIDEAKRERIASLRRKKVDDQPRVRARDARDLASDYQELTNEILARIAEAESQEQAGEQA